MRKQVSLQVPLTLAIGLMAVTAILASACAPQQIAPVRRKIVLSTEYHDERAGEDAAREVREEVGMVTDPEIVAYVRQIGDRLVLRAEQRSFDYQFNVVDQFEPNAFALPGGYVYISRGLLALVSTEDELANVLGHEITHAAARHAAAQQEFMRRQNPFAMPWVRVGNLAAYSRDQERDADRGGQMMAVPPATAIPREYM